MGENGIQAGKESLSHQPIKAEITFKFASVPLPEEILVCTLPIWTMGTGTMEYFDEFEPRSKTVVEPQDLDTCCFTMNMRLIQEGAQPTHVLPKGFYCNEFLDLNPLDIQDLLAFQRKYGRITGARKHKPYDEDMHAALRPEPDGDVFAGARERRYVDQLAGIKASQALYDAVPNEEFVDAILINQLSAVSFREAIAAVLDAQAVVRDLLRVQQEDLGPMTVLEALNAMEASEYLSIILGKAVPLIQIVTEGTERKRLYNLIDGVFIQLARGLLNNNAYRTCANPECRRTFTPREMNRRLDTQYCCSACQERAKRLRYVNRHSK